MYLRVPAEYSSLPELRETESGQPQTPPHPRKRTTADAGAAAAAAARRPDRKRLPCIQLYSVMTPLADSSMRRPAYSQPFAAAVVDDGADVYADVYADEMLMLILMLMRMLVLSLVLVLVLMLC